MRTAILPVLVIILLIIMAAISQSGATHLSTPIGIAGLIVLATPLILKTVREALRGNFATDAAATLAIITSAVLMQPVPGLIIVLMQSGGELLEAIAHRRASRALNELEQGSPRVAHLFKEGSYVDTSVSHIAQGDELLVRAGELVPVDATVLEGRSHLDTATITGEPAPITAAPGLTVLSGYAVVDGAIRVRANASAAESEYERIVDLVRTALAEKAPIHRLADRYAIWFTPLTLIAAIATYVASRDATRVLAVLVVATPCPLILATPIALIGGINRSAKVGMLFRGGSAIERLAKVRAAVFDKTGTLTTGRPRVERLVNVSERPDVEISRSAAAVELGSSHPAAKEIVAFAHRNGIESDLAEDIVEVPGSGIRGRSGGYAVGIGSAEFIAGVTGMEPGEVPADDRAKLRSYVSIDGTLAGYFRFHDELRPDLPDLFKQLEQKGFTHFAILSGDENETVQQVARSLGIDDAHGELSPKEKVDHVERIQKQYGHTVVIGDGTNDAPALAAADVGIAVTSGRAGVAAETADVILLGSDLTKIATAVGIARRTLRIAKQSIVVGLLLSVAAMALAAAGYIQPVAGALYQEAVDLGVIINALRASRA